MSCSFISRAQCSAACLSTARNWCVDNSIVHTQYDHAQLNNTPNAGKPDLNNRLANIERTFKDTHTHTRLTALFPGLPGWAGTRKVKPMWILLKQETVSGSGISWAICKSAPRTHPHHRASFITFLHLQRSMASSLSNHRSPSKLACVWWCLWAFTWVINNTDTSELIRFHRSVFYFSTFF